MSNLMSIVLYVCMYSRVVYTLASHVSPYSTVDSTSHAAARNCLRLGRRVARRQAAPEHSELIRVETLAAVRVRRLGSSSVSSSGHVRLSCLRKHEVTQRTSTRWRGGRTPQRVEGGGGGGGGVEGGTGGGALW
jgi:hypothetical protein